MAMMSASGGSSGSQLFFNAFPDAVVLRFHHRADLIGTLSEGIVTFAPDGRVLSANGAACSHLGRAPEDLSECRFETLFGRTLDEVLQGGDTRLPVAMQLWMNGNIVATAHGSHGRRSQLRAPQLPYSAASTPVARAARDTNRVASALERLSTGDPLVASVITKLRRVIGRDIPVLIHGETGTGKELLARAIHADSPRRAGPFVAVNCAAIPDGLIESELFGYAEGAFTGARRKGYAGRILQADGGTLFLDEIGDMPLALQARMLRVLQERVVTPLSSIRSIQVDIALVCATHRNLREWVANGKFREDLFYRLDGFAVTLPPLRARKDMAAMVQMILRTHVCSESIPAVGPELLALFERCPWPGNIRQLSNVLRTALVMAGDAPELLPEHLPDEFWADVCTTAAASDRDSAQAASTLPIDGDLQELSRVAIQLALHRNNGNVSAAARQLHISRNTLYRRLRHA